MEKFQIILEKAARQEIAVAVVWVAALLGVVALIWIGQHLAFRKQKHKAPGAYAAEKQKKLRRQSIAAATCLTVVCLGLGTVLVVGTADTVSDIRRDLEEEAYDTYCGTYHIYDESTLSKYPLYCRWNKVDLENGAYAYLYMGSIAQWLTTDFGTFEGELVYGKHSRLLVRIQPGNGD